MDAQGRLDAPKDVRDQDRGEIDRERLQPECGEQIADQPPLPASRLPSAFPAAYTWIARRWVPSAEVKITTTTIAPQARASGW